MKNAGIYGRHFHPASFMATISLRPRSILSPVRDDIGFTAKSIVLSPQNKDKGTWADVDSTLYSVIAQGVVVCR